MGKGSARPLAPNTCSAALQRGPQRGCSLAACLPRAAHALPSTHPSQTLARTVAGGGRGAEGAAATLAAFNIPLVYHLARRFQGRGLAREVGARGGG